MSDMQGIPYNQLNETMTSASTGNGTAFKLAGSGCTSVLVSCVDSTSAAGVFYFQVGDTESGNYDTLAAPTITKSAGTALTAKQMVVDKPGARWGRVRYVRSSGGAAAEITIAVSVW